MDYVMNCVNTYQSDPHNSDESCHPSTELPELLASLQLPKNKSVYNTRYCTMPDDTFH